MGELNFFEASEKVEKGYVKVRGHITDRLFTYVVVLISIGFMAYSFFKFGLDGEKSLSEILVGAGTSLTLGLSLATAWRLQGIKSGGKTKSVTEIEQKHETEVAETRPYYKYSHQWSEMKMKQSLVAIRSKMLDGASVNYYDLYDNEGNFIKESPVYLKLLEDEKSDNKRVRKNAKTSLNLIDKANKVKVKRLYVDDINRIDTVKAVDPNAIGDSPTDFIKKKSTIQFLTIILTSIFFGYLTYELLGYSWETFAFQAFQVLLYNIFGMFKYIQAYDFMLKTHVKNVEKKTDHLESLREFGKKLEEQETLKEV